MYERVLVVDDSKDIRDFLIEYILEPKGFEILIAVNGSIGFEMAINKEPDLIIVDQQMPKMTGLEMLQKLKEQGVVIPTILATAHGSEDTAVSAFRLGVRDYVTKPFDADHLNEAIDMALRENRLQRERDQLVQQLMESNSQLQRRAQELNVLYGVGKSVSSSLDLEEVLQRVVEAAVYVVGAEEGSLMLLDEEQGELFVRASKNLDSKAQTMRKRVNDSLAGRVLQTKRAIAIGNESQQWQRTHTALLVKSLIYVPLILQSRPIGVLGVANRIKETSFDGNDTRALSALAGYATIAISNANQFRRMEVDRNMLKVIVNQIQDPIMAFDEEEKLVLVNQEAKKVFELPETKLAGQPLNKLIQHPESLAFIQQPVGTNIELQQELIIKGQRYDATITFVNGGGRSIRLRQL